MMTTWMNRYPDFTRDLPNQIMHDLARHVGEAEIASGVAEGEFFVIES